MAKYIVQGEKYFSPTQGCIEVGGVAELPDSGPNSKPAPGWTRVDETPAPTPAAPPEQPKGKSKRPSDASPV